MTTPVLNYSGRDYTAEFERLLQGMRDALPEYTNLDSNHSDAGVTQGRLTTSLTDLLNWYLDYAAQEGSITWAQAKQSLIDIGRNGDYLPTLASPATTRLRLTRVTGSEAISIPRYTSFAKADGLTYLTADAVTIAAGEDSVEVNALQGEVVDVDIPAAAFQIVDWSGQPRYDLGANVAAGTVELSHGDPAVAWTEVDSFYDSWADDHHFLCELNADNGDTVWLTLGDGVKGSGVPDDDLTCRFVRTAGAAGNCGHSLIYLVPDEFEGIITCTQIEPATGGAAAESLASLRRMIPAWLNLQKRMITKPDYVTGIGHLSGVLHVQALDRNDYLDLLGDPNADPWPHLHQVLFIVPQGGGPMSTWLKSQILAHCAAKGHFGAWTERYILKDAVEKSVNVSMRFGVAQGSSADAVRTALIAAIEDVLAIQNRTIGGAVTFAELHLAASAVPGVSWVEFDAPTGDTTCRQGEIAVPGTTTATAV